ncbi:MAG: hypothetical protein M1825_001844 [Sarcosagium campestre]|nr:MAG: hypothetical protein M1825_001844 [Sarcosagium campestre]
MESVVFQDSPLAEYLEGEGEADLQWMCAEPDQRPASPEPLAPSFAPRGPSTVQARFRERLPLPPRLKIPQSDAVTQIHHACSRAVNARLGRAENARFLEQFRYTIIASQLLNADVNLSQYNPLGEAQAPIGGPSHESTPPVNAINLTGASLTAVGAFVLAWTLYWARGGRDPKLSIGRITLVFFIFAAATTVLYAYIRRRWLLFSRQHAVECASRYVETSQSFDAVASATIALIQEVELVSRGYRISSPLPPISRLEERSQSRRCSRLRHTLYSCLSSILAVYADGCTSLRPLAEEVDLDKYFDIYDLNSIDIQEVGSPIAEFESEQGESLKGLRTLLHQLYTRRKFFLCCLLALEADGGKPDFARWGTAIHHIELTTASTLDAAEKLRGILSEEEHFPVPPTPKLPSTPAREKVRVQLRKLSSLSQGIRGLQAKMHLLREESDRSLDEAVDVGELGTNLMAQYESIGYDLRMLMDEWESGKAALASNIDKNEKRLSLASSGLRSPTTSLGGMTAVEGSPSEALRALTGDDKSRSSLDSSNSDDEVFEAIALPRQRSMLTREERISRMKDDRIRTSVAREKAQANTHMLRELESVIQLRPRGQTATNRMSSV